MSYWIKYLDPIESSMSEDLFKLIKKDMSYKYTYYTETPSHKKRNEGSRDVFIGRGKGEYYFYSGFIPRVRNFCEVRKIKLVENNCLPINLKYKEPIPPKGFNPRSFQKSMVETFLKTGRGVLKAPTGVGKTGLGMYLIASIDELENVLWLSHTKDLMYNAGEEAEKWFGKHNVGYCGDGKLQLGKFFTTATRQTFKEHVDEWGTSYDMVILDEVHHLSELPRTDKYGKEYGEYGQIFSKIYAPIRAGITATYPDQESAKFAIEGLIGPLLEEFTINQAREEGYMAKPTIKIKKVTHSNKVQDLRDYQKVYEWGVVRRLERNKIIVDILKEHQKKNESVLIMVTKIVHGQLLEKLCKTHGIKIEFVYSVTDSQSRDLIKHLLNDKQTNVICTDVWKEGINIPELNVVINASGGKSDLKTLQVIGRGLRKTNKKSELIIYDFFDSSHRYLIEHFGHRFSLYCDMGWI